MAEVRKSLYATAETAYQYLIQVKHLQPDQIILYGHSLGGAVAIELATKHTFSNVIIHSSFTSPDDLSRGFTSGIPLHWFTKNIFVSIDKLKDINSPISFAHGKRDNVIPYSHSVALYEAAQELKLMIIIPELSHNEVLRTETITQLLKK